MQIKKRPCPVCQSFRNKSLKWFVSDKSYLQPYLVSHIRDKEILKQLSLVICIDCSCVYYETIPLNIGDMYRNDYRKEEDFNKKNRRVTNYRKSILWHSLLRDHIKPGAEILDVGCSEGFFVKFLLDQGYKAEGLEINKLSISYAKKAFDLTLYPIEILDLKEKKYDLVFNSGYMEHTENPSEIIAHIRDVLLKPNGLLYVQTPNLMNPNTQYLSQFFPAEHFQTFSPETMAYLLTKQGFEIVFNKLDVLNCGMSFLARKKEPSSIRSISTPSIIQTEHRLVDLHAQHTSLVSGKPFLPITPFLNVLTFMKKKDSFTFDHYNGNFAISEIAKLAISRMDIDFAFDIYAQLEDLFKSKGYLGDSSWI